jgi:hypothetical protein
MACPHRLPKLPESTQRKQAIANKGAHCSIVTVYHPLDMIEVAKSKYVYSILKNLTLDIY